VNFKLIQKLPILVLTLRLLFPKTIGGNLLCLRRPAQSRHLKYMNNTVGIISILVKSADKQAYLVRNFKD